MTPENPAAKNFLANLYKFTPPGLTGLADNPEDINKLGELLATGNLDIETLRRFILKYRPFLSGEGVDPQVYEQMLWSKIMGKPIKVPPMPLLRPKTVVALCQFNLKVIFLPKITEIDYPDFFVRPRWGQYMTEKDIKRRQLPGRWVAVETISKPHRNAPGGYGVGDADPLARELWLQTRFGISWDKLTDVILPKAAKLFGVSKQAARRPSAEEWNLIGNRFNWLRTEQNEQWPDLGSTNSWEWCENAYEYGMRLMAGHIGHGGLADVRCYWQSDPGGDIGFRLLVVL